MKQKLVRFVLITVLLSPVFLNEVRSAASVDGDSQLKFEPWLWKRLQRLEAESQERYISLIIRSPSHEAKGTLGDSFMGNYYSKNIRVLEALPVIIAKVQVSYVTELVSNPLVEHVGDGETTMTTFLDVATPTVGATTTRTIYSANGSGITIAIIDSGINSTHPDLADPGKVVYSRSYVPYESSQDYAGHGTFVSAAVAGTGIASGGQYMGVAPGARLINLKVFNVSGMGEVQWFIDAINWVIANRETYDISIINFSGGYIYVDPEDDGTSELSRAADDAVAAGIVFVAAQGNIDDEGASGARWARVPHHLGFDFYDPFDSLPLVAYRPPASPVRLLT